MDHIKIGIICLGFEENNKLKIAKFCFPRLTAKSKEEGSHVLCRSESSMTCCTQYVGLLVKQMQKEQYKQ